MATHSDQYRIARDIRYLLIALGVVLAALVAILVLQYHALDRMPFSGSRGEISGSFGRRVPLAPSQADIIKSWMTFDYVNHIFDLPPQYLATELRVSDPRYPRLSIAGYARSEDVDPNTFLSQVANAVRAYAPAQ